MSLADSFNEDKTAMVQSWADQGDSLSELQKKLGSELDVKVTYMELRFLLDDIGVKLKEADPEPDATENSDEAEAATDGADLIGDSVQVSISKLQRPGALISGTATFAGGDEVEWWLDQMGQLGMNPKSEDFRPSQDQMVAFQKELQSAVEKKGF